MDIALVKTSPVSLISLNESKTGPGVWNIDMVVVRVLIYHEEKNSERKNLTYWE